jgi:pSer/pThr/pTyr-binding forkhead associated (FHA) protein
VVLGNGEVICGRAEGELLVRDDPSVSPRHARFSLEPGGVQVTDLGSVNGTFLRLRGLCTLVPGDEIRVGRQLMRLEPVPRPAITPGGSDDDSTPWGSPDRGARLRLVQLLDGGGVGEVFPLEPGENDVGREVGSILFSQDRYVSGRHCKVEVNESGVTVTDLGSSNGTFVRIKGSAPLQTGDQILIGMQLLRFDA